MIYETKIDSLNFDPINYYCLKKEIYDFFLEMKARK
jgi:hypothetical protein